VTSSYNNLGQATTVSGTSAYVTATSYNGLRQLTGRTLGSGTGSVTRTIGYESDTLDVSTLTATAQGSTGSTTIQNDTYTRNAAGQVASLADGLTGQVQCFTVDSLGRMTDAYTASSTSCTRGATTFGPAPYDYHYTFDNTGDMQTATDNINSANSQTFAYGDAAHAHAPTSSGTGSGYAYDGNGDMTTRTTTANGTQTLAWDPLQQLTSITSGANATGYVYAADGSRLLRHDPNGSTELFVAGEELTLTGGTVTANRYYTAQDGATIAVRSSSGVTWLLDDIQGTASITVNSATAATTRQYYTPYGNQRGGTLIQGTTDRAFLGHVQDYGTGLLQDGARYYDPTIGHFASPDALNDANPQQLNAYGYAADNPVSVMDPSGLRNEYQFYGTTGNNTGTYAPIALQNASIAADKAAAAAVAKAAAAKAAAAAAKAAQAKAAAAKPKSCGWSLSCYAKKATHAVTKTVTHVSNSVVNHVVTFGSGLQSGSFFESLGTALNFAGGIVSLGALFGCEACATIGAGLSLASALSYAAAGDAGGAANALAAAAVSFTGGQLAGKVLELGRSGVIGAGAAAAAAKTVKVVAWGETKGICGINAGCGTQ
jgi:RHS repeat-associated protein